MDKENVVHIHNEILVIKKNEILPSATTWMGLKGTVLSETSQRKANAR